MHAALPEQRALHNHVTQVKPRDVRRHRDCPACSSINPDVMDEWYAQAWMLRIKAERDMERALRE